MRRRENEGRQAARKTREGDGAHYVSVISRIRRVFSICSKAPLVLAPRPASTVRARWPPDAAEKDAGESGRIARNAGARGEKRKEGRNEKGECDSREEEKPSVSARTIYACITRVESDSKTPREGEKIKTRAHVLLCRGLKHRNVFLRLGFREDSSCER